MIRLNYLKGVDIGHHRKLEKRITGNVLGLWGISGSGKTTVLQLIEWIISGKIEHPDAIAEFIRNNEHEDIKKMVGQGSFEVDGKPLEITRTQSRAGTATRVLKWDQQGDEWATEEKSAAGAEALMTSLIGANQKAISSIVFIRQGAFGKLFSGLDAERRDFFVRLLMLGHLEKLAQMTDTYRKQMMGSVQELDALRDQAVAAYDKTRANFDEADFELSRLRSYSKELEAGSDLQRAWDKSTSREADKAARGTALDSGLAAIDLDRARMPAWIESADTELAQMRDELKTAGGRLTSRNAYATSHAKLNNEITTIESWLERSTKMAAIDEKIAEVAEAAGKPDPRVRIAQLDEWERAYRTVDGLKSQLVDLPAPNKAALDAKRTAAEEARKVASDKFTKWQSAKDDLSDLQKLAEAAAGHEEAGLCRLCGSDHPDQKFVTKSIENTTELVSRLAAESNALEAARRDAAAALTELESSETKLEEKRSAIQEALTKESVALQGAPDGSSIVAERDSLRPKVPVYDAAKSMHSHLVEERESLRSSLGDASYTDNDLASKKSERDLAASMLETLPPVAELQALIEKLTLRGTELREKRDKVVRLRDDFDEAHKAHAVSAAALEDRMDTLNRDLPFLISSVQALGDVLTQANLQKVLEDLREKQSLFDEQKGKVESATRSMNDAGKALQELDMRAEEQKNRIKIGKELERVRACFLPSGITTEYLSHQFKRIAVTTQDHLAQMSADFMVVASEDRALSFDFMRLNEPGASWLSQNRMSGGQQVKLAIAVLLAIHELVIPQVGLLVLDEPSTHLDTDSKIALAEVLREIGNRGNFQLIVCDHSLELKDAYTDIIELADPE